MSKVILVDNTFKKDTKFPETLAKLAKLASGAAVTGQKSFKDPDDSTQEIEVREVEIYDGKSRQRTLVPGVLIGHNGLTYEAWVAGVTVNDKEYYKFRVYSTDLVETDPQGNLLRPLLVSSGQIFINNDRQTRTVSYDMQGRSPAQAARVEIANQLVADGRSTEDAARIAGIDVADLAAQPGQGRGSPVRLGWG